MSYLGNLGLWATGNVLLILYTNKRGNLWDGSTSRIDARCLLVQPHVRLPPRRYDTRPSIPLVIRCNTITEQTEMLNTKWKAYNVCLHVHARAIAFNPLA